MSDSINKEDFILKEENDDFKQSVIERQNVTTEFTLEDIENHQADLEKMRRELIGQMKVTQATVDNIERNHEFVNELSDEQKHHVWMYHENKTVLENAKQKLEQVEEQVERYKELLDVVYEKFGFVKSEEAVTIDPDELEETNKEG